MQKKTYVFQEYTQIPSLQNCYFFATSSIMTPKQTHNIYILIQKRGMNEKEFIKNLDSWTEIAPYRENKYPNRRISFDKRYSRLFVCIQINQSTRCP